MRIAIACSVLGLLPALARPASAQASRGPAAGDRVRLTWRDSGRRFDGEVVVLMADTLVVGERRGSQATLVPLSQLRSLHVYRGRRSGAETGAMVGGIVGFVGGALVGLATAPFSLEDCPDFPDWGEFDVSESCSWRELADAGWTLLAGLVGSAPVAGLGALIGLPFRHDAWERVPLDRLTARVAPLRGGALGLGFSLAF